MKTPIVAVLHCKIVRLPDTEKAFNIKEYQYTRFFRAVGKQWSISADRGKLRRIFERVYSPFECWGLFEEETVI